MDRISDKDSILDSALDSGLIRKILIFWAEEGDA